MVPISRSTWRPSSRSLLCRMGHLPIPEQERGLRLVLNGFYSYCAVPTNSRTLEEIAEV